MFMAIIIIIIIISVLNYLTTNRFANIQNLMEVPAPISLAPDPLSAVKEKRNADVGFAKGCVNGDAALDLSFPAVAE